MAQYYDVHPDNPQPRTLNQMVRILEEGGLIAYPTDSCYALGCALGNGTGIERIRRIRQLGDRHHFTLVISEFAQLGAFVEMDNWVFRAVKAATPGPYTFILKATRAPQKAHSWRTDPRSSNHPCPTRRGRFTIGQLHFVAPGSPRTARRGMDHQGTAGP